ncbi:23S rRNA (uracil(1939)-C(5))-methyltransferase RlmD [Edwardsiella tarda]|nr:23S rRNA (uracil(1939)-C(5))-methyltransferase RlmD [Edwardsiella tarda]
MAQFYTPGRRTATRKTLIVTANDLDAFGQGVARDHGKTLFISGLLPGEQAEVILTEDKRQFARGRVKRLLSQSPERVAPRCPHAGVCGGCQQQHASIALQQQSKSQMLQRLMARETGVTITPSALIAGEAYGYRRRARFGLQFDAKRQRVILGFRQAASNDLVALRACPVLAPPLEALLLPLGDCLSALRARRRLGHLELVLADNGPLMVLRHLDPLHSADQAALEAFARQHGLALYLSDGQGRRGACSARPPIIRWPMSASPSIRRTLSRLTARSTSRWSPAPSIGSMRVPTSVCWICSAAWGTLRYRWPARHSGSWASKGSPSWWPERRIMHVTTG